jgi:hypothetical protein
VSPALPPTSKLARWAVKYGPLALPYARRLYEHGRFRQLALMHARTLADGTFSWEVHRGERVWVVWSGDEVVATYPERPDLRDRAGHPFPAAKPERRQDPDELTVQRLLRRAAATPRPWSRDGEGDGG